MSLYSISKSIKNIEKNVLDVYRFLLGILKIIILSRFKLELPKSRVQNCIILGNGPSLKETINLHRNVLQNAVLFVVNNFSTAKEFKELKPANYIVLDPGYFIYKERADVKMTFNILKNEVTWNMNFFVPYMYRNDVDIIELKNKNRYVKICFYNYTLLKGPEKWIFPFYKKNLAMPQFYNVMGAAILVALNSGYKKVWLVGADHSWFDNLQVGNDNIVYRRDIHFYDSDKEEVKLNPIIEPVSNTKVSMEGMFWALHAVFKSYGILSRYSTYLKSTIINASEFSYLDTFIRKNLTEYEQ
jgi:hypothetical protein